MAANDRIEGLRRAILQDAEGMARIQVKQAEDWAAAELETARSEAESEQGRILHHAAHEAEALRRRIESTTEVEVRRRQLEVRERLLRQVLDRALAELEKGVGAEASRSALQRLVVEAARETGGGRLVVQTAAADAKLLTPGFLAETRSLLAMEGISAELRAAERPAEIAGGAIVSRDDGRLVVDNSFEARLRRQEAGLRAGIWRILTGEG